jgi:Ring finger domain
MLRNNKSKCKIPNKNIIKISKKYQSRIDKQFMKVKIQFYKCSICLCFMDQNDKHFLPCCHYYHKDCIERWLQKNITCPTCKTPVFIQTDEQYIEYNKFLVYQRDNPENILTSDHNLAVLFIKNYLSDNNISYVIDGLNLEYINSTKVQDMIVVSENTTTRYLDLIDNGYESDMSMDSSEPEHSQNRRSSI